MAKPSKKVVLSILDKLGIEHSDEISLKRAKAKLERAIDKKGIPEDTEMTSAEIKGLGHMGYDMDVEEDDSEDKEPTDEDLGIDDDGDDAPSKKKSKKGKKGKKGKKSKEEKKEKKGKKSSAKKEKKTSAKKDKKKSGKTKHRKTGVIATIIEILQAAKKPIKHESILKKLEKKFPEREPESMIKTVKIQVPNRLNRERNLKIVKIKKGFIIK